MANREPGQTGEGGKEIKRQEADTGPSLKEMTTHRRTSSRSTSPRLTRSATTPIFPSSQSLDPSPLGSREPSPNRPQQAAPKFSTARFARSRKNSNDQSPQRTPSHTPITIQATPSAAAVERALAAVGPQKLLSPTATHTGGDAIEPRKTARGTATSTAQARLKSPPSTAGLQSPGSRTPEQQTGPSGIANHSTSKPSAGIGTIQEEDDSTAPAMSSSTRGGVIGGTLETVREDDPDQVPGDLPEKAIKPVQRPSTIQEDPDEDNPEMTSSQTTAGTKSSRNTTTESGSGSDGTGNKRGKEKDREKPTDHSKPTPSSVAVSRKSSSTQLNTSKPPSIPHRRSFQHLTPARNKEGSVKSMTVETETVSNPDLLQGDREGRGASSRLDHGGSVRAKASSETIRPRKEKKRIRKPPSITSGNASSKADIFEAKVASAVDEAANSSDSEETFVYESNPPEARSSQRGTPGHRFHHSRTPSAASVVSQSADGHHRNHFGVAGKRSMKFTNTHQFRDVDDDGGAAQYQSNTVRSAHRPRHHLPHINRAHQAPTEGDSPTGGAKSPRPHQFSSWRTHRRGAPHQGDGEHANMGDKQSSSLYDLSAAAEADDEFTPLLPGQRRNGANYYNHPSRRGGMRPTRNDPYKTRQQSASGCVRIVKYSFAILLVAALIAVVVGALTLCNRALWDVHVKTMYNVLASEQELFVEFEVHAVNPNLVDVSIAEGDLDIFAKSKYVGTTEMWRDGTIPGIVASPKANSTRHRTGRKSRMSMEKEVSKRDGVDEGTDPMPDPEIGTPHTMLLGKLREFENPLIFEASPFQQKYHTSVTGLRLPKPGNKTEEGGTRRWENVLQHPFELIVRGRMRYYLPLSSKALLVPVSASVVVQPESPIDGGDDLGGGRLNETVGIGRGEARRKDTRRTWWG